MTTDPTAPRDLSGTPGHEALRRYWEVPPGGLNPRRPTATPKGGDILSNLMRSQVRRSHAIGDANRLTALAAHDEYIAGMTLKELQAKYHLAPATFRDHWRKAGLPFAAIGERRKKPQ